MRQYKDLSSDVTIYKTEHNSREGYIIHMGRHCHKTVAIRQLNASDVTLNYIVILSREV